MKTQTEQLSYCELQWLEYVNYCEENSKATSNTKVLKEFLTLKNN